MNGTMSYTGRDIVDIRQALVDKIPELTDKWKDFNESDLGMVILELIAGAQDMQNYYFDTQAFETYLDTAQQPKNIRSLLRAMNYKIPLVGSARGEVQIKYKDYSYRTVNIPKYFKFGCSTSNLMYVASDTVHTSISDGEILVPVMEGEYREKRMTRGDFLSNVTVLGNVSRRVYLDSDSVADGSVEIEQSGVIWREVDDAFLEYDGGYVFSIHRDSEGSIYLLMSVNFLDLIPQSMSEEIIIKYVVSHGTSGRVDIGYIDSIIDERAHDPGVKITEISSVSNLTPTYGAYDEPDLERLKILARRQARTMGRYITLDDYKIGVETEPYIRQCIVADWKTRDLVEEPYIVKVWAVDWSGQSLGKVQKQELIDKLESKGVSTIRVEVQDTNIIKYNIHVKLILRTQSVSEAQSICELVRDKLMLNYNLSNMSYGGSISLSILDSRIRAMSSYIKDVLIISPTENIQAGVTEFPELGLVTVESVDRFE